MGGRSKVTWLYSGGFAASVVSGTPFPSTRFLFPMFSVRNLFLVSCALFGGLVFATASASAAVTAGLSVTRTRGVAPLAVHFDASETTSTETTRPFHDLHYAWEFGDPNSGTWKVSGRSKNRDTGPIAAHVYERPGTYTVTLTVRDASGASDTKTVTIEVEDPEVVFAAENTICFSTDGDFGGAPAGAKRVTSDSWDDITAALGTGKRVLLKRGHAWNYSGKHKVMAFRGPGILGAFGEGPRPVLRYTSSDPSIEGAPFTLGSKEAPGEFEDFRFMDLEIDGAGHERHFAMAQGESNHITFLRVRMHHGGSFIFMAPSVLDHNNRNGFPGHSLHAGVAFVETEYEHIIGNGEEFNTRHIAYIGGRKFTFLGNVWNDATRGEHVLRFPVVARAVIAHNALTNSRARKHVIKLHGSTRPTIEPKRSEWITISDNYFSSDLGDWTISLGPQNNRSNEIVEHVILERNEVVLGHGAEYAFHLCGSEMTVRNNVVITTAPGRGTAVYFGRRGVEPPPVNNRAYNNSAFNGGDGQLTLVQIADIASNTTVRNNFGMGRGPMVAIAGTGTGLVESNNVVTSTPGWVEAAPTKAAHFQLTPESQAIDAGTAVPVFDDYLGVSRPQNGKWDLGAFEFRQGDAGKR